MITIERERFETTLADAHELLRAHWREVALYQAEVPLAPDFERYRTAEKRDALVVLAARDEGRLIGYSVFLLHWHLHYKTCLVASNDVLFLAREHRRGSTAGLRLITASEDELGRERDRRGATQIRVTWHIKPENDWSAILKRRRYKQEEIIMGKLLPGERHGV